MDQRVVLKIVACPQKGTPGMSEKEYIIGKELSFPPVDALRLNIHYSEVDANAPSNTNRPHIHEEAEIYFNLSGDVCFMVEQNLYRIEPGSILITRPNEYHHCIYQSNAIHCHYWLLLSVPAQLRPCMEKFFRRPLGADNLIKLRDKDTIKFEQTCSRLVNDPLTLNEQYENLFRLLRMIDSGEIAENEVGAHIIPEELRLALDYIDNHMTLPLRVREIAEYLHVSINTLERYFTDYLDITPSEFIKDKRLLQSKRLLSQGMTVQEACMACGFSDCSRFIAEFQTKFGMTPLKYKKALVQT